MASYGAPGLLGVVGGRNPSALRATPAAVWAYPAPHRAILSAGDRSIHERYPFVWFIRPSKRWNGRSGLHLDMFTLKRARELHVQEGIRHAPCVDP